MARKNDSPQKAAMRERMSVILEGALNEELDEELGYSKYDYRNKETNNSRNGHKDVLGMYVGENESAKFWSSIMNGLKNRGIEDILIACVDGITGFFQAIEAVYPQTEIQQCMIHQIRKKYKWKIPFEGTIFDKEDRIKQSNTDMQNGIITPRILTSRGIQITDVIQNPVYYEDEEPSWNSNKKAYDLFRSIWSGIWEIW